MSRGVTQRTRDAAAHIAAVLADEGARTKRGCAYKSLGVTISSMNKGPVKFIRTTPPSPPT